MNEINIPSLTARVLRCDAGSAQRSLLIVDDDIPHCEQVSQSLSGLDLALVKVNSLDTLGQAVYETCPDVVILDPVLGGYQALTQYQSIQYFPRPSLVVCTSDRGEEMRIQCAQAGVDYLLYKPIVNQEIPLLIENLLGRQGEGLQVDLWRLDPLRWKLYPPQGEAISLAYREMLILLSLSHTPGIAVSREKLVEVLGLNPECFDMRRMEILMRRLRKKITQSNDVPLPLSTVHGIGYAFNGPIRVIT
ncbi:winged helix-turn-helix domain-containing protein [Vreelandella aquamarina]|uniref:response regulator transcription factor n=1 Tax=Vreelandella aquamarina TaxID=77097 RepID=UPI00384A97C1